MEHWRITKSWAGFPTPEGVQLWDYLHQRRYLLRGDATLLEAIKHLREGVPTHNPAQHLAEVSGLSDQQAQGLLHQLRSMGALHLQEEDPLKNYHSQERPLYHRQSEFFSLYERDFLTGQQMNHNLRNKTVMLVGVGGFGTWLALMLSRIGVQKIIAIDPDQVELSNLSRQVLYTRHHLGMNKVDAAKERVQENDPEIEFEGHTHFIHQPEDLLPLLEGVDLVFNAFGVLPGRSKDAVTQACLQTGTPFLLLGGTVVGPLCVPGKTPCPYCMLQENPLLQHAFQETREMGWMTHVAPFAPMLAFSAAKAVWHASRFLSGCDDTPTLSGAYFFNMLQDQYEYQPIAVNPHCKACGSTHEVADVS